MPASPAPFSPGARPLSRRRPYFRAWVGRFLGTGLGIGLAALGPVDPALAELLRTGDLGALEAACSSALQEGDGPRLRQLQQRLLTIHPAPQPLAVVLVNADGLLRCAAPDGALRVLARVSPAAGAERRQWLVLQWRAAQAGLHHQLAAEALERLAAGDPARLAGLELPIAQRQDGTPLTRPALDLWAGHLESLGQRQRAAEVLLSGGGPPGPQTAARLAQAVALLDGLAPAEQDRLLELALEQAAAAEAWGLVAQILDQQLALAADAPDRSARVEQRRLRLSGGIDDAYGELVLRRRDPAALSRSGALERQLRSPRSPGGHAEGAPTVPAPPAAQP